MPVHLEWYSDEFGRLLKRAALRRITLHESRHTTLTLMEHAAFRSPSSASGPGTATSLTAYDVTLTCKTWPRASRQAALYREYPQ